LRLFVFRDEVTREKLESLQGKLTGVAAQGEMITLKIVPLAKLWREAPDAKALAALYLYQKFLAEEKKPKCLEKLAQFVNFSLFCVSGSLWCSGKKKFFTNFLMILFQPENIYRKT